MDIKGRNMNALVNREEESLNIDDDLFQNALKQKQFFCVFCFVRTELFVRTYNTLSKVHMAKTSFIHLLG